MRIVTPGTREANNGNWRTAVRWAAMLRGTCRTILQTTWDGEAADALVALHAQRSAPSLRAFHERSPGRSIGLVLTGTDLYRDLALHREAGESLEIADHLVVLQEDALAQLPAACRRKARVIFQSARALRPAARSSDRFTAVAVGHLREEKDPQTLFRAIALLPRELPVRFLHVGAPLDEGLARLATQLAKSDPRYHWAGSLPHGLTRSAIKRAHVLVHPSRMEGGANVIVEAIMSGTPVIASRISGNVGMLGKDYPGLFPLEDAPALATMLARAATERAFLERLRRACRERRPLFLPAREAAAVRGFVRQLLA